VTVRGLTLIIVLSLMTASCRDDDPSAASTTTTDEVSTTSSTTTTTVPERPTSTTTTAFDPASIEGQVEAAYLKSWDVYADAVYNLELDEQALSEVYAGDYLVTVSAEIVRRTQNGEAASVAVEHDYSIRLADSTNAVVIDKYQNHQVLIDFETKQPIEQDPDEMVTDVVTLALMEGIWKVIRIEEVR